MLLFGEKGRLETVAELKVEIVCQAHLIQQVMQAFKENHPYEMPAYQVIKCEDF